MTVMIRVRAIVWFATGALFVLVASLVVVSAWRVDAAPGDTDATFVAVEPCRLFDTRPGVDNVGPRATPLQAGEQYVQQVTGTNGNCVGIPSGATAIAMNVTIVNPTAQSNLRLYPGDAAAPPLVSNLNWLPGQSPTPNKVDVKLSPAGQIVLLNHAGTVDVLADVVGYYRRAVAPFVVQASGDQQVSVEWPGKVVRSVTLTAPVDGAVTVHSTANAVELSNGLTVYKCSINTETALAFDHEQSWETNGNANVGQLAGVRVFPIAAGTTVTFHLFCHGGGSTSRIKDSSLAATFTPTP